MAVLRGVGEVGGAEAVEDAAEGVVTGGGAGAGLRAGGAGGGVGEGVMERSGDGAKDDGAAFRAGGAEDGLEAAGAGAGAEGVHVLRACAGTGARAASWVGGGDGGWGEVGHWWEGRGWWGEVGEWGGMRAAISRHRLLGRDRYDEHGAAQSDK